MRELVSTGNALVARAAVECGCNFFGGYPITPSSEIAHELSVLLPKHGGTFIQMEDEIAGISVALGACASGAKAMTASSGPGISLKAEQIGLGFIAEIPLVIVNVMRGGPSTGLPTRVAQGDILQAKNPTHGDVNMIVLAPSSLEECYTQTVRAFNLAARFMTPVMLLLDETIGHMQARVRLPEISELEIYKRREFSGEPKEYKPYEAAPDEPATLNPFFKGYHYHITGLHHGATGFPTEDGKIVYDVHFEDGTKAEFSSNGNIIEVKSYSGVPSSVVPSKVQAYVRKYYPKNKIVHWEKEWNKQKVELDNDLDLEFTLKGDFLRIDD